MGVEVFGPGTSVDVTDEATRELGRVTVTNPTETGLAKELTLQDLLAAVDDGSVDSVLALLKAIRTTLQGTLTVDTGASGGLTDVQLRASEVGVADATVRSTLSSILTELNQKLESGGTVALDAATLAALESVTAQVNNFPAEYPLPAAQVTTMTPQKNALTNTELRASAVPVINNATQGVSGTVTVGNPTDVSTLSTETTLEAVRVQVAAVNTNTDAIEAILSGQNKLLGEDFTTAHQNGLNFVGGERLNFGGALATNRYVAAIRNPSTNTKVAYVYAVVLYTSVTQWFRWAVNPTLDSPEAVEAPRSLNLANPGVATLDMLSDTIAPTTADFWSPETRVTQNGGVPLSFPRPVAIAPGTTFAVIGESSATQETCANVYFYEKAI